MKDVWRRVISFLRREKWALVKTYKLIKPHYPYSNVIFYVHLFESSAGRRRIECLMDGSPYDVNQRNGWLKGQEIYQLEIYRWLSGRYDPNIPRYSQIGEDDTANGLRGTVV